MIQFAPVTLAMRGEASMAAIVATSLGRGEPAGWHARGHLVANGVSAFASCAPDSLGDTVRAQPEVGRNRTRREDQGFRRLVLQVESGR